MEMPEESGRPPKLDHFATGKIEGPLIGTMYGMPEMSELMEEGVAQIDRILEIEGTVPYVISVHYPHIVPPSAAAEIREKANRKFVRLDRVRELDAVKHHFEDSIYDALREVCSN
jgi:adenylosuccinate lyase